MAFRRRRKRRKHRRNNEYGNALLSQKRMATLCLTKSICVVFSKRKQQRSARLKAFAQFLETKTATLCSIKSFCVSFLEKRPPIKGRGAPCRPPQRATYPHRPTAPERGIFKPQGGLKRGKPQVGFPHYFVGTGVLDCPL